MSTNSFRDREILTSAQQRGALATLFAFFRLSGPGWLQSAITLGGGSLTAALYLGAIGGMSMLWINITAIIIGVIMLSAISHITLSTGKRPYAAMIEHVNPVLGVGWIAATMLANMIFIIAQVSLAYDIAKENFAIENLAAGFQLSPDTTKLAFTLIVSVIAFGIVLMNYRPGIISRIFDLILKLIVAAIVICFVMVVVNLFRSSQLDLSTILLGCLPDPRLWFSAADSVSGWLVNLEPDVASHWREQVVSAQQKIMIGAAATAVGINMTFLLPYSMLERGWDKPFRGLAVWDLVTGMAIPFIIVTSCIGIAAAYALHGKVDEKFASSVPAEFRLSPMFAESAETRVILQRRIEQFDPAAFEGLYDNSMEISLAERDARWLDRLAEKAAALPLEEKQLAVALTKPTSTQFARSLEPILGANAKVVYGLGAFGMVFSTMIILMLINGYAFGEMFGRPDSVRIKSIGSLLAAVTGICWLWIWTGDSRIWLMVLASNFGMILLPIAYFAFLLMMNNRDLMGGEKPQGVRLLIWNVLMTIGVIGAVVPTVGSISAISEPEIRYFVMGAIALFLMLGLIGFSARLKLLIR